MQEIKIILLLLCAFIFFNCRGPTDPSPNPVNNPPEIFSLTATPDSIKINESCELTCIANDPDGDNLNYTWASPVGIFTGSGSIITWTAPNSVGTYSITCKVDDGKGGKDSSSLNIVVQEPSIPSEGLYAFYPFDGNANDEGGNGHNGTIYGNSVQFVSGPFNQSIKFDNSNSGTFTVNDYVGLPNISINEISISHWVKFISGSSTFYDGATYSIGQFPSKQFMVRIKNSGMIFGQVILNSTHYSTSQIDISDHDWHFITVTVNRDFLKIYHNGSVIDSTSLGFDLNFVSDYHQIALHRFSGNMSSRFTGELDNLRIYNKTLTPSEVSRLYNE